MTAAAIHDLCHLGGIIVWAAAFVLVTRLFLK
jgi:hypothetical protein